MEELRTGTRCACELSQVTETAPTLLSYHLGILRDAGLVTGARRGRWIDYTLVDGPLERLADAMAAVREVRR